jgi:hypothetical protein
MANDIFVSFGADTGPLESASARARAEIRGLTAEMNGLGRDMQRTGASMDSELGSHLNALGSELAAAKAHMAELTAEMRAKGLSNDLVATLDPAVSGATGLLTKFVTELRGAIDLAKSFRRLRQFHRHDRGRNVPRKR